MMHKQCFRKPFEKLQKEVTHSSIQFQKVVDKPVSPCTPMAYGTVCCWSNRRPFDDSHFELNVRVRARRKVPCGDAVGSTWIL